MITPVEIGMALAAGSLTTLSPCVLPMLPVVLGGAVQANRLAPAAIGAGMVVSFAVLGVAIGVLGDIVGLNSDGIRIAGAWLLLAMAVVLLVPGLSARMSSALSPVASVAGERSAAVDPRSLGGAFLLGGLLGMVWSPCSGPLLGSTLMLVASEGGAVRGGLLLGLFGLGAAVPLVGLAYVSRAGFMRFRDRVLPYMAALKTAFGIVVGLVAIAILTGVDKRIEAVLTQALPDAWLNLTVMF
ncbi:MAG: cytochrome c biogenesis CcdA family protein [Pseudomonadota bacterium]